MNAGAHRDQKGVPNPMDQELEMVVSLTNWVLVFKFRSSTRAVKYSLFTSLLSLQPLDLEL